MDRKLENKLIAAAARGDRPAAEALIKAHQGPLYSYILRMSGRPELAEDVVQEAFVRVLANLDRFDTRYRFSTWLFTIARRVFLNILDKKQAKNGYDETHERATDTPLPGIAGKGAPNAPDSPAVVSDSQSVVKDALQSALLTLPSVQREVVILFHQSDWPIWLVAEHLQLPVGTVKSHLHRGRERLRVALARMMDERRASRPAMEIWPIAEVRA